MIDELCSRRTVVRDPTMRALYRLAEAVAKSPISVLILGESGTGKEMLAEAVHARSPRSRGPFVRLNCAALPDSMVESELFGHERGAFTGAVQAKPGLFEAADGGTAFLDEVGELSLPVQAKLLRVLESGELLRLGSVKPRRVDVRFVTATNADLSASVAERRFRLDLFFRLNGICIQIPPLRERPDDVIPLAEHFLEQACRRAGRGDVRLSKQAAVALRGHAWPGNVRELRNVIERAVVLSKGDVVDVELETSFPPMTTAPAAAQALPHRPSKRALGCVLATLERQEIFEALRRCDGNQTETARALGISRRTLFNKLTKHGFGRRRDRFAGDPQAAAGSAADAR